MLRILLSPIHLLDVRERVATPINSPQLSKAIPSTLSLQLSSPPNHLPQSSPPQFHSPLLSPPLSDNEAASSPLVLPPVAQEEDERGEAESFMTIEAVILSPVQNSTRIEDQILIPTVPTLEITESTQNSLSETTPFSPVLSPPASIKSRIETEVEKSPISTLTDSTTESTTVAEVRSSIQRSPPSSSIVHLEELVEVEKPKSSNLSERVQSDIMDMQSSSKSTLDASVTSTSILPSPVDFETRFELESYGRLHSLVNLLRESKNKALKNTGLKRAGDSIREIHLKFEIGVKIAGMEGIISLLSLCPNLQSLTSNSSSVEGEIRAFPRNSKIYTTLSGMTSLLKLECWNLNGIDLLRTIRALPNLKTLWCDPGKEISLAELKKLKLSTSSITSLSLRIGSAPINLMVLEKFSRHNRLEALQVTYELNQSSSTRFCTTIIPSLSSLNLLRLNDLSQEKLELTTLFAEAAKYSHLKLICN